MSILTDNFVAKIKALVEQEDKTMWDIGDLLADEKLDPDDIEKLAALVHRKPSTLRDRQRVAVAFGKDKWSRDEAPSWGVFKELSRIVQNDIRKEVLARRPKEEWTIAAMKSEVDDMLKIQAKKSALDPALVDEKALVLSGKKSTDDLTSEDKDRAVNILVNKGLGLPKHRKSNAMWVGGAVRVSAILHENDELQLIIEKKTTGEVRSIEVGSQFQLFVTIIDD